MDGQHPGAQTDRAADPGGFISSDAATYYPAMVRRLRASGERPGTGSSAGEQAGKKPRRDRLVLTLDLLGLHRRKRETIRAIGDHVEVLEHLVGLAQSVADDTFADDEPDALRASSTLLRAAAREMMSTSVELAGRLGELRFMAFIQAITIEDGPEE